MLHRLRDRAELLIEALARERFEIARAGQRGATLGGLLYQSSELFRLDRISEVQMALAGAAGEEERRLRYLLQWLVHRRADCQAASELDGYLTWRSHSHLAVGAESVPVRAVGWVVAQEADRARRDAVHSAYHDALADQRDVLDALLARRRDAVEELGYGSYIVTAEVLSGVDLRGLAREAARFLDDTETLHRDLLGWYLPRLTGVDPADAREPDLVRLFRAAPYDRFFSGRNLAPGLTAALAESGLDPLAGGRIRLRTQVSRASGPGAAAHPLRIPDEVVLVISPHAGRPVHADFLSALGSALHRAFSSPALPMELRWLGDRSVTLGFARLLEGLLLSPPVLARLYGVPGPQMPELLRYGALQALHTARVEAARLQFAVEGLGEEQADDARYAELLSAATGGRVDPRGAPLARAQAFAPARVLRAIQLQGVLSRYLRERFDEDWYRNPRAGPALQELMSTGRAFGAAELAVQVGSPGLAWDAALARITEAAG